MERRIVAYGSSFINFYQSQDLRIQKKIDYVFDLVKFEKNIPLKFFKHLDSSDGIYEIRVITSFKSLRFLCFFDSGDQVVIANCFIKKSQRTPQREIVKAERLKKEYLKNKNDD